MCVFTFYSKFFRVCVCEIVKLSGFERLQLCGFEKPQKINLKKKFVWKNFTFFGIT